MRASLAAQRQLSRFLLLLIAAVWFGLLFVGCADYQGDSDARRISADLSRACAALWLDCSATFSHLFRP